MASEVRAPDLWTKYRDGDGPAKTPESVNVYVDGSKRGVVEGEDALTLTEGDIVTRYRLRPGAHTVKLDYRATGHRGSVGHVQFQVEGEEDDALDPTVALTKALTANTAAMLDFARRSNEATARTATELLMFQQQLAEAERQRHQQWLEREELRAARRESPKSGPDLAALVPVAVALIQRKDSTLESVLPLLAGLMQQNGRTSPIEQALMLKGLHAGDDDDEENPYAESVAKLATALGEALVGEGVSKLGGVLGGE